METNQEEIFNRTRLLLGDDVMTALASAKVIIFGVGGVGSWCAEGLVRSGTTRLTIVDADIIAPTNINRQLMATTLTVGDVKVDALKERLLTINPQAEITAVRKIYCKETAAEFNLNEYDYVIDAVDSLKDKVQLIMDATASSAEFVCSLGAALKIDPLKIKVAEFWDVSGCPLGAALRKKMKREGLFPAKKFRCVYDDEVLPNRGTGGAAETDIFNKAQINGTTAHVTAIFGMTLAGLVIQDLYQCVVNQKDV